MTIRSDVSFFKRLQSVGLLLAVAAGISCGTAVDTSISPTVGTIATVEGIIRDARTWTPLTGVTVVFGGQEMTTGADGQFFMHVHEGDGLLSAYRPGFVTYSKRVSIVAVQTFEIGMVASPGTT